MKTNRKTGVASGIPKRTHAGERPVGSYSKYRSRRILRKLVPPSFSFLIFVSPLPLREPVHRELPPTMFAVLFTPLFENHFFSFASFSFRPRHFLLLSLLFFFPSYLLHLFLPPCYFSFCFYLFLFFFSIPFVSCFPFLYTLVIPYSVLLLCFSFFSLIFLFLCFFFR